MKKKNYSGFLVVFQWADAGFIDTRLKRKKKFTAALTLNDWKRKEREVFIVINDQKISALCLARKGKQVVTLKHKVEFFEFVKVEHPIPVDDVLQSFAEGDQLHLKNARPGNTRRVPETIWFKLIERIKELRPEISNGIDRLINKRKSGVYDGPNARVEAQKWDATYSVLSYAGIDPRKVEVEYTLADNRELPPFMEGFRNPSSTEIDGVSSVPVKATRRLQEKDMLHYDTKNFFNSESLPHSPDFAAIFNYEGKILKLWNYDNKQVEHKLGVDLIYFNEHYQSFIVVQYKRLDDKGEFRPNARTYKKEFKNLKRLDKILRSGKSQPEERDIDHLRDHRMHNGVCYFKLCDSQSIHYENHQMIRGMYYSLDYWKKLMASDKTVGKQGGKLISTVNSERYFNNTIFTHLVGNGWVGSSRQQSDLIHKIINEILDTGRSLILAQFKFEG